MSQLYQDMSKLQPSEEASPSPSSPTEKDKGPEAVWDEDRDSRATIASTAINIVCNIVGGAILALPGAFSDMSIILAIMTVLIMGAFSVASMNMLIQCAEALQSFSYKEILQEVYGKTFGKFFDCILFSYTFGILVAYARIVSESMPEACEDLFGSHGFYSSRFFWLVCGWLVFFPFSSMRALHELKWVAFVGIVTIAYIVFVIVVRFILGSYAMEDSTSGLIDRNVVWFDFRERFFAAIGVISVSFSCHYNVPVFYQELRKRSPFRFAKSRNLAMSSIMATYIVTGMTGYMMFGDKRTDAAEGDIVNAFAVADVAAVIGRIGLFFHFCCVYPVVAMGARRSLNNILFDNPIQSRRTYIIEAFGLVTSSCFLGYVVPGIGIVIQIVGALFGISIVFIVPGAMYARLFGRTTFFGILKERSFAVKRPISSPQEMGADDREKGEPVEAAMLVPSAAPADKLLLRAAFVQIFGGIILSIVSFTVTIQRLAEKKPE